MDKILITAHMRQCTPITAQFCTLINDVLRDRPDITLAEFAQILDEGNKENESKRLQAIVRRQLAEL